MDYKDSEFYKQKERKQVEKFRELSKQLPDYAAKSLQAKEFDSKYSSLIQYCRDLQVFFNYLKKNNPTLANLEVKDIPCSILSKLDEDDFLEYEQFLRLTNFNGVERSNNNKSIARKLTALRNMFAYLLRKKYINNNIVASISIPKYSNRKSEIIRLHTEPENNELERFLKDLDGIEYSKKISKQQLKYIKRDIVRDTAILYLLLGTGIRVSELEGLDVNDVDLNNDCVRVKRKGGFYEVVYFNDAVKEKLVKYINTFRSKDKIDKYGPALFLSTHGKRISTDGIRDISEKYTLIIVNKRLSPHKLRATYGTYLYKVTGDIRLTADVLGHKDINTTAKHYAAQIEENKRKAGKISLIE